jgi:hypothetical protein
MTQDKVDTACDQLTEALRKAPGVTLAQLHEHDVFEKAWKILKQDKLRNKIYAREGAAADRFRDAIEEADPVVAARLRTLYDGCPGFAVAGHARSLSCGFSGG